MLNYFILLYCNMLYISRLAVVMAKFLCHATVNVNYVPRNKTLTEKKHCGVAFNC